MARTSSDGKNTMKKILMTLGLCLTSTLALADLKIVATTSSMGMLARTVGGSHVKVTELAPPDRDAHTLQVRPSMMQALRQADLVVSVGAELELGWLPAATEGAGNPRLLSGNSGYFEAAAQVPRLDVKGNADRSQGDVHPLGNPHVQLDPVRMGDIALALANRLGKLDAANTTAYLSAAIAFKQSVGQRMPRWQQATAGSPGVLLYHHDANYFLDRFNIPVLGYIEPVPGIPPSASHILKLAQQLRGQKGVILHTVYQGNSGIARLAEQLGWKETGLPLDPPTNSSQDGYFNLIDQWAGAVARNKL